MRFGGKLLFDAHEFSPAEFEDRLLWRLAYRRYAVELARRFAPQADAMTTVSWGIAKAWRAFCGVEPAVITNAPPYQEITPSPVQPDRIRMVHHGGAVRSRHLERMLELMALLDERFTLDLILVPGDAAYIARLKEQAKPFGNRVRFLDPVPPAEIPRFIAQYDIGLYMMPDNSLNNRYALPNKFFEFVQARLAVAVWPVSEMPMLAEKFGFGIVAEECTVSSMADSLRKLTCEDVSRLKRKADKAAREFCYEANFPRWQEVFDRLGL
ncbi:glycosyltransferase [Candidatus Parcubacteria bacterium]|nr:MAG: glycosyltransferase [Candidatus Parcubacteria bacterium]